MIIATILPSKRLKIYVMHMHIRSFLIEKQISQSLKARNKTNHRSIKIQPKLNSAIHMCILKKSDGSPSVRKRKNSCSIIVCSNGTIYPHVTQSKRLKRLEKRFRRLQRKCSRKYERNKIQEEGGVIRYVKTRNMTKLEMQKLRIQMKNIREDYENKRFK